MQKHIPQAWLSWLHENLANKCTVESLAKIMQDNKFDPAVVMRTIASMQDKLSLNNTVLSDNDCASLQVAETIDFVYDKPRIAMEVNHIDTHDRRVYISAKMAKPVIVVLDNLLSHAECDELVVLSRGKMQRSKVVDNDTGAEVLYDTRTSSGTFFQREENQLIKTLERRIAEIMGMPLKNGEGLQILHYQPGAEYTAHFDYFPYEVSGSKKHLAQGGQRVATMIMYLNDVTQGGETDFPNVNFRVIPKKGAAVYFEYCNNKNQVNHLTLHAGLPVIKGEKWIATKWVRQHRYN